MLWGRFKRLAADIWGGDLNGACWPLCGTATTVAKLSGRLRLCTKLARDAIQLFHPEVKVGMRRHVSRRAQSRLCNPVLRGVSAAAHPVCRLRCMHQFELKGQSWVVVTSAVKVWGPDPTFKPRLLGPRADACMLNIHPVGWLEPGT